MSSAFSSALGSIITIFLGGSLVHDFPMATVTAADISNEWHIVNMTSYGFGTDMELFSHLIDTCFAIFPDYPDD